MLIAGTIASFLAFFVKGISGFANTLVFSSILSFFTATRNITPIDLLIGFPPNLIIAWRERRSIQPRIVIPLVITLLIGMIPGTFFLKAGNEQTIKAFLGVAIVILALIMMWQARRPEAGTPNQLVLTLIGIFSGFLCGLFGIGAFLVLYINSTTKSSAALKANICCVFIAENIFRIAAYAGLGLLNGLVLRNALLLIPGTLAGLACGLALSKKLPEKATKTAIHCLLLAMGITIFLSNI